MFRIALFVSLGLALSACAGAWQRTTSLFGPRPAILAPAAPQSSLQRLTTGQTTAAQLDRVSAQQKAVAVAARPSAGRALGSVSVALGSPAEPGLWLKSSLVSAPAKGRVVLANGTGVNVDLLPAIGGASLSLSAYRALGLALTDLPQVQVQVLP